MACKVKIIADSISPLNVRITTWELTYPRFVHAEFMTHRILSRNASSSRAIKTERLIASIQEDPAMACYWGEERGGMQAIAELDDDKIAECKRLILEARDSQIELVKKLHAIGLHKQIANRYIEPWMNITVIATATNWMNLFCLRDHKDAMPEIAQVAHAMIPVLQDSKPVHVPFGEWHLPYVPDELKLLREGFTEANVPMICSGRCAKVSYLSHDGEREPLKDLARSEKLLDAGHMCFDDQTEVLTKNGWTAWPQVVADDNLFAVDPLTKSGNFEKPSKLHSYDVEENMYHVKGQQLDLKVTLNHRMVVSARKNDGSWSPFGFDVAGGLIGKPRRYLKSAMYDGHSDVPTYERSASFMRLLGFFIGDGYALAGNQARFHLKKKRKIEYLKSLGFQIKSLASDHFAVVADGIGEWFRTNCYDEDGSKILPKWVLDLTEADSFAVFDGLRNSDGSNKRKTWVYDGTSKQVIDMLQALLHVHGKVGSITRRMYGDGVTCMRVNVSDRTTPRVETEQSGRALTYSEAIVPYKGRVYCATVSTGALLVRRNSIVSVSGNSPFEHAAQAREDMEWSGNFKGWTQFRKTLPGESLFTKNPILDDLMDIEGLSTSETFPEVE